MSNEIFTDTSITKVIVVCRRTSMGPGHDIVLPPKSTARKMLAALSPRDRRELWAEFAVLDGRG